MKYLIPTAFLALAACTQPAPEPDAGSVAGSVRPNAATHTLGPTANSPAEASVVAQAWLEAKYPGREVRLGEPGAMEGAAGSIYIEIPATVTGAPPLGGTVVLRRVNDVPGSTAEQRRWHVASDTLK